MRTPADKGGRLKIDKILRASFMDGPYMKMFLIAYISVTQLECLPPGTDLKFAAPLKKQMSQTDYNRPSAKILKPTNWLYIFPIIFLMTFFFLGISIFPILYYLYACIIYRVRMYLVAFRVVLVGTITTTICNFIFTF